ncbi:MAG: hypothetical protein HQL52_11185 [Magnetococcales bacterium]|nr:hypothetical protein [Magnetococcales bacterium]
MDWDWKPGSSFPDDEVTMDPLPFQLSPENFTLVRKLIEGLIEAYRLNAENWVIARFRQIPSQPDPATMTALNRWMEAYLPETLAQEIALRLQGAGSNATGASIGDLSPGEIQRSGGQM